MQPILAKAIASLYKLPLTGIPLRFLASVDWKLAFTRLEQLVAILLIMWLLGVIFCLLLRLLHHKRQPAIFLEITPPKDTDVSALSTAGLFALIGDILNERNVFNRLFLKQPSCSFEIVSRKETGVRFMVRVPKYAAATLVKSLRAYLPGMKVEEAKDYLPPELKKARIITFRSAKRLALPLNSQTELSVHDPLAYLTANMTQLGQSEVMAVQMVVRPLNGIDQIRKRREIAHVRSLIRLGRFGEWARYSKTQSMILAVVLLLEGILHMLMTPLLLLAEMVQGHTAAYPSRPKEAGETPAEKELGAMVENKLSQPMLDTSIKALILAEKGQQIARQKGLSAAFASYRAPSGQGLIQGRALYEKFIQGIRRWEYKTRFSISSFPLSASELASLYHFPYNTDAQTEDLVRVKSRELPAPLSLKNNQNLDVVFGKNTYGNTTTLVGLTDDDRSRHMYLIGQTGSGKSTVIYHMASDDIRRGRGVAVVDPHGDLATDLLGSVPNGRANDLIYFNPFDVKYPVGINLLELSPCEDDDELELEKELVCESVISIFRRVFSKDENADAHRIEYVLRNTIHTAFTVPDCTIFTVYNLLNDPAYRKATVQKLTDKDLLHFWKNEFGQAGNFQIVKMVGGVTAKVGRFLFSPVSKRILEQPKSTVSFDEILDGHKIFLCNLAEGKIGEDTSQLLGTTVIAKIHQAAMRRARRDLHARSPFYLFIDEFQNFATSSFTRLLSGGRKFGLRITIAEQSTAQQDNRNIVNVILANTGTTICFRTASPVDEELMLAQFAPAVERGDIGNLPCYHFYIRLSAVAPEAPFSGETLPMKVNKDAEHLEYLINASRQNYAVRYQKSVESMPIKETLAAPVAKQRKVVKAARHHAV